MPIQLDLRTLSFMSALVSLTLSLCTCYVAFTQKTYPGFNHWTSASILNFIGMLLLGLRNVAPDWLSILGGNAATYGAAVLILLGLQRFTNLRPSTAIYVVILLFYLGWAAVFTYLTPDLRVRILLNSGVLTFIFLHSIVIAYRHILTVLPHRPWLLISALFSMALCFGLRIVATWRNRSPNQDLLQSGAASQITFLLVIVISVLLIASFIILNTRRLEYDLALADKEIKTLKDFLPICAHCKKIRNDAGYWQQIESYLADHADVRFSHGICVECSAKLYPEYAEAPAGNTKS